MREFPASPITALIDGSPQYDLGEATHRTLSVADILDPADCASLSLGYGTSAGDAELRALIAARLGIPASRSCSPPARPRRCSWSRCCTATREILVGVPCFPPMLDALRGLRARVVTVPARFEDGYRVDLDAFRKRPVRAHPAGHRRVAAESFRSLLSRAARSSEMLSAMSRRCPEAVLLVDETYREQPTAALRRPPPRQPFRPRADLCLAIQGLQRPRPAHRLADRDRSTATRAAQLAKFDSSVCCSVLDEFLAARLLSRADQLLSTRPR